MPVERTKTFTGMYTRDVHNIPEGKARLIQNLRPKGEVLETREGCTEIDTIPFADPIQGLGRLNSAPGDSYNLAVCHGRLYQMIDGGAAFTSTGYSDLHRTNLCKILQFRDVALVIDQSTGVLVYKIASSVGVTPYLAGLPSPKIYKLIDSFEVAADWTVTNGTATNEPNYITHGKQSVKFAVTTPGATMTATKALASTADLNGAVFSDLSSSNDDDYISIDLIRSDPNDFSTCHLRLGNSIFTNYFTIDLALLDAWIKANSNYASLTLQVRKKDFEKVGTPSWDSLTHIRLVVAAMAGKSPTLTADFLRLEKTGPILHEYFKEIASFNPTEAWSGTFTWNHTYSKSDNCSMQITGNQTVYLTGAWNLTTYVDGKTSATIDNIQIWLGKGYTHTPTVTVNLYTVFPTDYFTAAFIPSVVKGLLDYNLPKASWAVGAGVPDWASIVRAEIVTTNNAGQSVFLDDLSLVEFRREKMIIAFEPAEGIWTATTTSLVVALDYSKDYAVTWEGSVNALHAWVAFPGVTTLDKSVTADLSIYSAGVAVQTVDEIELFFALIGDTTTPISIELRLGNAAMAAYYTATFSTNEINSAFFKKTGDLWPTKHHRLFKDIADFTAVGAPNWATIEHCTIVVTTENSYGANFAFDRLMLRRGARLNGDYSWKVVYLSKTGEESDASFPSDEVTIAGGSGYLTNLPISPKANLIGRRIYRIGGTSAEWHPVVDILNMTTLSYSDVVEDENLGTSIHNEVEGYPYIPKAICVHDDKVVIANLTGPDGVTYPSGIMVSKKGSYEIFDDMEFFEIEKDSGKQILWLISAFNRVFVGKEDSIWSFDSNHLEQPPKLESRFYSAMGLLSVVEGENEFYFYDKKSGIVSYNGSYFAVISDDIKPNLMPLIGDPYYAVTLEYYDDLLLCNFPSAYGSNLYVCYKPNDANKFWFYQYGWDYVCTFTYRTTTTYKLLLGGAAGIIYYGYEGDTDNGIAIASALSTAYKDFNSPEERKDYARVFLFASKVTALDATLILQPTGDGIGAPAAITLTIDSSLITIKEVPIPSFGGPQYFLSLQMITSQRIRLKRIVEVVRAWGKTFVEV